MNEDPAVHHTIIAKPIVGDERLAKYFPVITE